MFNFALFICRPVRFGKNFRLLYNKVAQNKRALKSSKYETVASSLVKIDREVADSTREGISFTTKYLNEVASPEEIQWDWLTKKLEGLKINNVPTKVLQACIRLNKLDLGLKYYDYLVEKGVKLSAIDLMFFSKLLAKNKSEIKKHEKLLINFYDDIKEHLHSSLLIRNSLMEVFVEIPVCFKDIVERGKNPTFWSGYKPVVEKSLELNMPDTAFEFMKDVDFAASTSFIESYINFCIRNAKEGKFSIDFINRLIDICAKKALPLSHDNLLQPLKALVSTLNEYDSYRWSVHECELNEKQECSICGSALLPNSITDEEFRKLKEHFFKQSFFESDVFLSSTRKELRSFLKFLKTTEKYTLVLDGLNLIYKNKQQGIPLNNLALKYFLDKGYKILTIARIHSKRILTKGNFLQNKNYKSQAQFFFTSDMSEDDLFILYATLYGGQNTFFVTGDYLNRYIARLEDEMKCAFLKWQISHQYVVNPDKNLMPPLPHCGLPQLTLKTNGQYIWHLSQQISNQTKVCVAHPINWYCLAATKK